MNSRQKEILHQHRHFLIRNIVWSDHLANKLLSHGVVTESQLKEIQDVTNGKHGRGPVYKLLEVLPIRGASIYTKFCDVLHTNGHPFIADLLREEEGEPESTVMKDLYKRAPNIEKALKDNDKKLVEQYITEKVKESSLKATYNQTAIAKEKDKAIEAKQKQLEDSFEFEEKIKRKNVELTNLETQINEYRNDIIGLKSENAFISSKLQDSENKFRSDIGVQMKFSMANENALQKVEERFERSQTLLTKVSDKLKYILRTPTRNSEREQMALMEFPFAFLAKDFDLFLEKYHLLQEIEKQYENLLQERNYILAQLGFHSSEGTKPSLLTAYRDFAVKTDQDMTSLKEQLEKHNGVIEGQQEKIQLLNKEVKQHGENGKLKQAGTVWQSAIMSVMRKQLNDVKHDSRIKETKIEHFESEIVKLKAKIAELELTKRRDSIQSFPKHGVSPRPEQNGLNMTPELGDNESRVSKSDSNKKRNHMLPPLGGRILFQTTEKPVQHSPRKSNPRAITKTDNRPHVAVPEGLITHQVKLEHKGYETPANGSGGKMGNVMSHGLGNLKSMHGKHGRQAPV